MINAHTIGLTIQEIPHLHQLDLLLHDPLPVVPLHQTIGNFVLPKSGKLFPSVKTPMAPHLAQNRRPTTQQAIVIRTRRINRDSMIRKLYHQLK